MLAEHVEGETAALLLERAVPGTPLTGLPDPEQDVVLTTLLRRLWIEPPAGHRFRPLSALCDAWAAEAEPDLAHLDPGLVRADLALFRGLPRDDVPAVLLPTDMHAGNVLAARREPWLVIDPKPYVGDPAYDVLQHLLDHPDRLVSDPRGFARRVAGLAGLDADRVLLWLFARSVVESAWRPYDLLAVARALAPR